MMLSRRTTPCLAVFLVLAADCTTPASPFQSPPESFSEILARGRIVEESLTTIRARFTETTTSSLLMEPIIAKGHLVGEHPDRLLLQYEFPERKTLLVEQDRLTIIWPERNESEQIDITRTQDAVDKYFRNASEQELRSHFDIEVRYDGERSETYRIEMLPRRKTIREGLTRLQLWLNPEGLLLVKMAIHFPTGDSKLIELEGVEINTPLQKGTFDLDLLRDH